MAEKAYIHIRCRSRSERKTYRMGYLAALNEVEWQMKKGKKGMKAVECVRETHADSLGVILDED